MDARIVREREWNRSGGDAGWKDRRCLGIAVHMAKGARLIRSAFRRSKLSIGSLTYCANHWYSLKLIRTN